MKKVGLVEGRALDGLLTKGVCCWGSCHVDEHCSSVYLFDCRFGRSLSGVRVMLLCFCLLLYVHGKHLWSCRDGHFTYPYFSRAGLDLLSG